MIGELNRRIIIKDWGYVQDAGGGSTKIQTQSYEVWAKVESRSGTQLASQGQPIWNYDYKIHVRYERTRMIISDMTVDYDGKRLVIKSVSFEDEGDRRFAVLRCSTVDNV